MAECFSTEQKKNFYWEYPMKQTNISLVQIKNITVMQTAQCNVTVLCNLLYSVNKV